MANINNLFPSKWLKAGDIKGRVVNCTISAIALEDIGDESKVVAHFRGATKGMVLNKTNSSVIADAYGDETDGWIGKPVQLYCDRVPFQGKLVDAIRIRIPLSEAAAPPPPPPPAAPQGDDDIPF